MAHEQLFQVRQWHNKQDTNWAGIIPSKGQIENISQKSRDESKNFKKMKIKEGPRRGEERRRKRRKKKDLKTIAMNNKSVLLMACPKCSIFM